MQLKYIILLLISTFVSYAHGQNLLTIEQCRQLSLEHNRQLKSEQYRLQATQANTQAIKKDRLFTLDGTSNVIYNAQKLTNEGAAVNDRYLYRGGINANQLIYSGGKLKYNIELSKVKEKESESYINLSELDVIYNTDHAYWNSVTHNEYVAYWKLYLDYLTQFITVVNERVESGLVGQSDLLTARVKYNEGEIALAHAIANYKRSISELSITIGKPANTKLNVADSLTYLKHLPDTINIYDSAIASRPEMRITKYHNEAIEIQKELIKSKYRFNINAGINLNYGNKINADDNAANIIGMASLGIPINRWGKKKDELSSNSYQSLMAVQTIENTKESIQLEIHLAYISLEEALTQITIANSAKESAKANLKIANNKYKEGLSSIIEVTDAQTILQNAVINYIQSKANYYYSLTAYNRAIGHN